MKEINVAIIGLGKMGLLHSCVLSTISNVKVVAFCDKSRMLRKIAKKLYKNPIIVDDIKKLSGLHLDCAYVTAPIPAHYPIVNELYSKNIAPHVFVEKTLASNWQTSDQLCALPKKSEVNMVGYMKRFSVTFGKAKSLLNENALGELVSFYGNAFSSDFVGLKSSKSNSRGGVLSDLGSHIIDTALWFFGDFKVETASIKSIVDSQSEDVVNFKVKKKGLTGEFDISWCMENYRMPNFAMTIQGTDGFLKVNDYNVDLSLKNGERFTWYRPELNDNAQFLIGDAEYYREDEYFIKSIMNRSQAEPSFRMASKVDYVIEQTRGLK